MLRRTVRAGRIERAGARHQDAPVAVAPAGTPHLLTVQDVVVAVEFGPRRQRAEVAAGPGLGEQLAPHVVGVERRPQVLLLLLGRAEALDRPAGEHEADHVEERGDPGPRALEHPDAVVLDGEAAPAVLLGPVDAGEAGVANPALPREARASIRSGGQIGP